jgi:hypothetical protein
MNDYSLKLKKNFRENRSGNRMSVMLAENSVGM